VIFYSLIIFLSFHQKDTAAPQKLDQILYVTKVEKVKKKLFYTTNETLLNI